MKVSPNASPSTVLTAPDALSEADTSPALRLWQALTGAHASLGARLDPEANACAVLGSEAVAVLLPLAGAPDHRLRMHELAERSYLTRSGLTRRVDGLVTDGLVARVVCPSDGRGSYAQVTPAGLSELVAALPHHISSLERYLCARLDVAEIDTLTELLRKL